MYDKKSNMIFLSFIFIIFALSVNPILSQISQSIKLDVKNSYLSQLENVQHQKFLNMEDSVLHQQHALGEKSSITATGDSLNVRLIGRWANGPCYAVDVVGNIAYFGNGAYLEIVDFSNPANPVDLGKALLPSIVRSVTIKGNYAYIANDIDGLRVIDVNNASNPKEVGFLDTGNYAVDVAVDGSYAYVADRYNGLRVIDVTNPSNPQEIGFFNTSGDAKGVTVNNDYAYVADDDAGLRIINVTNPNNPQETGFFNTGGDALGVAVNEDYAFVVYWDGMQVIDISNPSAPQEIGSISISAAENVVVDGNYAYVASFNFQIIDISDPSTPQQIGLLSNTGFLYDVAVNGSYAFISDGEYGLRVIDINDLNNPREAGHWEAKANNTISVAVKDSFAYVVEQNEGGLRVLDISNPGQPEVVGSWNTGTETHDITISGNYAYIVDMNDGFQVIDISDPIKPNGVGNCDTRMGKSVAINENYAYVAAWDEGLRVIDISNVTNPQEIGFLNAKSLTVDVSIKDNYAYIAEGNDGLRVIDISIPGTPTEIASLNSNWWIHGVIVSDNYAYLADERTGLRVINISNPSSPIEVGSIDTDGFMLSVLVNDSYAYVADSQNGIRIIDISNPNNPQEVGFYDTGHWANKLAIDDDYIYVADYADGLYILEFLGLIPNSPTLSQPSNNSYINDNSPTFSWNVPSDTDGDDLHFKIEIATDNSFTNHASGSPFESSNNTTGFSPTPPVSEGSGTCSYTMQSSLNDGSYFWRVSAWDGQRYGDASELGLFTIDTTTPHTANHNPAKSSNGVSSNTNIVIQLQDTLSGVNQSTIIMKVNDNTVAPTITGTSTDYTLTYDPPIDFGLSETITVSIDADDNAGNSMPTDTWSFTTVSDQSAPQITHTSSTTANSEQAITISTTLTDNINVQSATIYYRKGGDNTFQSITMNNSSDDTYEAAISSGYVTERGLEYYISTSDNSGNTASYPASNPSTNPQVIRVHSSNLTRSGYTPAMAYRMISVPIDLDSKSISSVLEDDWGSYDRKQWRILQYINGNSLEYMIDNNFNNSFSPGKGFWLITKEAKSVAVGSGYSVSTGQNYTITLQPGWNQIGNPFAFPVNWSDVVKTTDVENQLVGYYGSQNELSGYDYTKTVLQPWEGYFVINRSSSTTTIEIPPQASTATLVKSNIFAAKILDDNEWAIQLTVSCDNYIDKDNYLGCLNDALDECDHHDFSEAPFFEKHVSLYFPHEGWDHYSGLYTGDFRAINEDGQYWDFCILTNIPNSEVVLDLSDMKNIHSDWAIQLLDKENRLSIDLKDKNTYTYHSSGEKSIHSFRILVGKADYIQTNDLDYAAMPEAYELSQNYPNPFNPVTHINYCLSSHVQVKIAVYNLLGQQIKVLVNSQQNTGRYQITWDGMDENNVPVTSGVYVVRMHTGSFVGLRKMILAR